MRDWMGIGDATFYDQNRIAILPMAFCFPGYDAKGSDLPPPKICSKTWHEDVTAALGTVRLTLLVGGYAHKWHLGAGAKGGVTQTVADWRTQPPAVVPLPHPSWRNTAWIKRNQWFADDLLPVLRQRVKEALDD